MKSTKDGKAKSTATTEGGMKAKGKEPIDYHLKERQTKNGSTGSNTMVTSEVSRMSETSLASL